MNTGIARKIIALAAMLAVTGCATTGNDLVAHNDYKPILSAEQVQSMIRVEVRELEPLPVEDAIAPLD